MKRQNTHLKHKQRFWIDIFQKKKNIQIANKHMKRCSTSLAIRETQTKTIVRHNFTPTIMAMIKKTDSKWRYGEIKTLIHCWWECRIMQSLWKTAWQFLKQQQQQQKNKNKKPPIPPKKQLPYNLAISFLGVYWREITCSQKLTHGGSRKHYS